MSGLLHLKFDSEALPSSPAAQLQQVKLQGERQEEQQEELTAK